MKKRRRKNRKEKSIYKLFRPNMKIRD
jgi:hypothetical protein